MDKFINGLSMRKIMAIVLDLPYNSTINFTLTSRAVR